MSQINKPLYLYLHTLHKRLFEPALQQDLPENAVNSRLPQSGNHPPLYHLPQPIPPHIASDLKQFVDAEASKGFPSELPFFDERSSGQVSEGDQITDRPEYHPSRRGAPCGYVFKNGDGVFRCRNCALDDTCVMCYQCFHASNHEGHETAFMVSSGGGCCDCGDPEAWKMPLICSFHSLEAPGTHDHEVAVPVPEDAIESIRSTVSTVLDFIIDTFNSSPTDFTLPTLLETIVSLNPPEPGDEDCGNWQSSSDSNAQEENTGNRSKRDMFLCILWNDETHTFDEVIFKVQQAIGCTTERASEIAINVDAVGRDVIASSYQISRLLAVARAINENRSSGLNVTIRTVRDTFRENAASFLVSWLRELPSRVRGVYREGSRSFASVSSVVRNIICEELCFPRRKVRQLILQELSSPITANAPKRGLSMGDLLLSDIEMNDESGRVIDTKMRDSSDRSNARWRLDFLIGFDSRLWKSLRKTLKEFYVESLIVSGEEHKRALASRFVYTYPLIAESYLTRDREYDLSVIDLAVQLFTVPTIAEYLWKNTSAVFCLMAILKGFFLSDHYPTVFPYNDLLSATLRANRLVRPQYSKLTLESPNDRVYKHQKYGHIINDLKFFLAAPPVRVNLLRQRGNLSVFNGFLDLCRVLQGMYPQKRHIRSHVEYESQAWTNSFYLSANLSRVLEHVGDGFAPTTRKRLREDFLCLRDAIKLTMKVLDDWCAQEQLQEFAEWDRAVAERGLTAQRSGVAFTPPIRSLDGFVPITYCQSPPSHRVLDFKALGRSLTLHCPLHWVLAKLLTSLAQFGVELGAGTFSLKDILLVQDVEEPKPKDMSDLSFVQDLDTWGQNSPIASNDTVTLPPALPVPPLLQQISDEDHIIRIFDHPLRTEVFLAQIRSGLWVRNGLSMRSQQLYFKHILLREMYDLNIFLLQVFASVVSPDRFMSTLLDRYDVRAWFEGNVNDASKRFFGELSPCIGLAEDLLNLLIVLLTERTRISGCLDAEVLVRREIIHTLALSPNAGLPHSKIVEIVTHDVVRLLDGLPSTQANPSADSGHYFLPRKSMDQILLEVSTFKPPTSTTDKGLYELRDECYDEVDPWFHHYTRSQREEVESTVAKRLIKKIGACPPKSFFAAIKTIDCVEVRTRESWEKLNAVVNEYGLTLPKIELASPACGFSALDNFASSKAFSLALLMSLHNMSRPDSQLCKSDHALASVTQLLLIGVELDMLRGASVSKGSRFVDQATILHNFEIFGGSPMSVIRKVLEIIDRGSEDSFKDHVEKLCLFIWLVASFGASCGASEDIRAWQLKHANSMSSAIASQDGVERERRKAEAKQRQAAIMAKFAEQQKSFMDNLDDGSDAEDIDDEMDAEKSYHESSFLSETRNWNFPSGTCIMCQEEFKGNQLYGMLCFSQPSHVQRSRYVDFRNASNICEVLKSSISEGQPWQGQPYVPKEQDTCLYEKLPRSIELYPTDEPKDVDLYTSSCGHLMHATCFEQYFASIEGRQSQEQRLYAENIERGEFLCPLCKSLGNIMLPIRNASKEEKVNWSGSINGGFALTGSIPEGKGGEQNSLFGLLPWWNRLRPTLSDALNNRYNMSTDESSDPPQPTSLYSVAKLSEAQLLERVATSGFSRRMSADRRRNSDAARSSDGAGDMGGNRNESTELQDLLDRLMTPMIRLTDDCLTMGLLGSFDYTICALERFSRGTGSKVTDGQSLVQVNVLEQLGSSSLTFLRVLAESIVQLNEFQGATDDFDKYAYPDANTELQVMFSGMDEDLYPQNGTFTPQLEFGAFSSLVRITFSNSDPRVCETPEDIYKWISICWASEVLRVVVAMIKSIRIHGDDWFRSEEVKATASYVVKSGKTKMDVKGKQPIYSSDEMMEDIEFQSDDSEAKQQIWQFLWFVLSRMKLDEMEINEILMAITPDLLLAFTKSMTLPFLRSSAIYLYARFYIVPPSGVAGFGHMMNGDSPAADEYDQLRLFLQIPPLTKLFSTASIHDPFLSKLMGCWIEATNGREVARAVAYKDVIAKARLNDFDTYRLERSITLESPAIFSLIGLPNNLESLYAVCFRQKCKNCDKVIADPALCLVCGTLVCSLSYCCHKDKKGECNNHMKTCSGEVGIFFLVKRFRILYLHNEKGCVLDPPYLDIHGEVDRKGSRQFLHMKRYNEIRKLWLNHGLASYIAWAVEANHSYGGWSQY